MDKYDRAIEALRDADLDEIRECWSLPWDYEEGCLFQFLSPTGHSDKMPGREGLGGWCGCPTQVKRGNYLTHEEVRRLVQSLDIPTSECGIKHEHLQLFAEVQRKADEVWPGRREAWAKVYPDAT